MKKRYNRTKTITCPRCASLKFETIIITTDTKKKSLYKCANIICSNVWRHGDTKKPTCHKCGGYEFRVIMYDKKDIFHTVIRHFCLNYHCAHVWNELVWLWRRYKLLYKKAFCSLSLIDSYVFPNILDIIIISELSSQDILQFQKLFLLHLSAHFWWDTFQLWLTNIVKSVQQERFTNYKHLCNSFYLLIRLVLWQFSLVSFPSIFF